MKKELLQVIENKLIARGVYLITLEGDLIFDIKEPGQFVHIKCAQGLDPLLRRPLSICDVDKERSQLKLIYRAEGKGTRLLANKIPGETVDVLGPLGKGFPYKSRKVGEKAVLIGGGIGVPPLYYLSKLLNEQGVEVVHILGFQSAEHVFFEEEFKALGETHVVTVDGSHGGKGLVTDMLSKWSLDSWDAMYSCGPTPMLQALAELFADTENAYLSLEQRMGCGIGACFACVCHTPDSAVSYKKICSDGPVFRVGEVII